MAYLVHRVHAVAQPQPGVVTVCESVEGWRFLPGGRLEQGESLDSALARELLEEAGCEPTGDPTYFFSQVATSRRTSPYRPGVPHPVAWWPYVVVPTRIVGEPEVPDDGEQIVSVVHLPVADAIAWLDAAPNQDNRTHALVLRLASRLQLI